MLNWFRSKIQSFPEYHALVDAANENHKVESDLFAMESEIFKSPELSNYGSMQVETFQQQLFACIQCGITEAEHGNKVAGQLTTFSKDLEPLFQLEENIIKWKQMRTKAQEQASKAKEQADAAQVKLERAQQSGNDKLIAKCDDEYERLNRVANDAQRSSEETNAVVKEKEDPYKKDFLKAFVGPLQAMCDIRIAFAEEMLQCGKNLSDASAAIDFYDDDKLHLLREKVRAVEQKELEEFGSK